MGQLSAFMRKSMRVKIRNPCQLVCEIVPPIVLLALAILISAVLKAQTFDAAPSPFSGAFNLPSICRVLTTRNMLLNQNIPAQPVYLTYQSSNTQVDASVLMAVAQRMANATASCGLGVVVVADQTSEQLFDQKQDGWSAGIDVSVALRGDGGITSTPRLEYALRMSNQDRRLPLWGQVPRTTKTVNGGADDAFKRTLDSITSARSQFVLCEPSKLCTEFPYAMSGFTHVQMLIEAGFRSVVGSQIVSEMVPFLSLQNMWLTYYPHPEIARDLDLSIVAQYLGFSYIACTFVLAKQMLSEKERRIKEGMYIMSMKTSTFWLGWFLTALVSVMPISLLVLLAGLGIIFKSSSAGLVVAVVLLFALSLIALTFLVYTIFQKPRTGGTFLLILQIIGIVAYTSIQQQQVSAGVLRFLSLLSPLAFLRAATLMAGGVKDARATDYSIGQAIGLLLFDTFAYLFFAWYLDKVIQGEFGQALPWYFIFSPSYWSRKNTTPSSKERSVEMQRHGDGSSDAIQPLPADADIAVQVSTLRKVFRTNPLKDSPNDKVAVNGLSFGMVRGQIFSLLGHNGAGKTTTISMMTGITPITSGDITVNQRSVRTDMDYVHRSMGFCPQHDVLYDELSVEEHLQLYGEIKGMTGAALQEEIDRLIPAVDLQQKRYNRVNELSGGMKRKLSVAIAYIANPELVILDEPTAGLDPLSRRKIWELINGNKASRTTLLTTHFLDEADILGDRIGIMANGVMKCLGTSLFLKQRFGLGYTLGVVKDPESADSGALRQFVQFHIPTAEEQTCTRGEQSFRLPMQEKARFPPLLTGLRQVAGVMSYGLSITTLEEVFLRIADESEEFAHQPKPGVDKHDVVPTRPGQQLDHIVPQVGPSYAAHAASTDPHERFDVEAKILTSRRAGGGAPPRGGRLVAQAHAVLLKRLWQTRRSLLTFAISVGLPIILLFVGGALSTLIAARQDQDPIVLTPAAIWGVPQSNIFYSVNATGLNPPLAGGASDIMLPEAPNNVLSSQPPLTRLDDAVGGGFENITSKLMELWTASPNGILSYPAALAFGGRPNTSAMTVFDNQRITHSLPVLINQLPVWAGATDNVTIVPTTAPLTWKAGTADVSVFIYVTFFVFAFCFPPGYIGVPVVAERVNKTRHLLRLMGMRSLPYWAVTAMFDWLYMMIPSLFTVITVLIFKVSPLNKGGIGAVIIVLLLYQFAVVPFVYVLARFMSAPENFQLASITLSIVIGLMGTIAYLVLDLIGTSQDNNDLQVASKVIFYILNLVPVFNVSVSLYRIGSPPSFGTKWTNPSFADVMGSGTRVTQCIGYQIANIFLYSIILAVLETNWFNRLITSRGVVNTQPIEPRDSDVINEKERLLSQSPSAGATGVKDTILMRGLRKVYPARGKVAEKVAVNSMYLGIPQGEVFGLLGTNGAGKTTTMKMLTGDINPSGGEAEVDGHDIFTDIDGAYKVMGYCPQFDALWNDLTGREHLRIFSMVKGVPDNEAQQLADTMLTNMSLGPYADKLAGTYSGGNKRKLSVTVALMASPKVVYLDEPATGMDPASRRFMWAEISSTMSSRAVILTTHSMEEAEALCNRIGIVVNGELQCLGSAQHLKNKFGTGLQIQVHTLPQTQDSVIGFITHMFPHAAVVQSFAGNIAMEVEAPGVDLGALFTNFEAAKSDLHIMDYSISQTTLEQVFLRFARGQIQEDQLR